MIREQRNTNKDNKNKLSMINKRLLTRGTEKHSQEKLVDKLNTAKKRKLNYGTGRRHLRQKQNNKIYMTKRRSVIRGTEIHENQKRKDGKNKRKLWKNMIGTSRQVKRKSVMKQYSKSARNDKISQRN